MLYLNQSPYFLHIIGYCLPVKPKKCVCLVDSYVCMDYVYAVACFQRNYLVKSHINFSTLGVLKLQKLLGVEPTLSTKICNHYYWNGLKMIFRRPCVPKQFVSKQHVNCSFFPVLRVAFFVHIFCAMLRMLGLSH